MCKHSKLKYFVKWAGWHSDTNTWEEEKDITAAEKIAAYWAQIEANHVEVGTSETLIRDLQGELECPKFIFEPERLYRKR